jgi:PEGA domain.
VQGLYFYQQLYHQLLQTFLHGGIPIDCPFCGETVPDTAKACPVCGFPFTDTAPVPSSNCTHTGTGQYRREKPPVFIILLIAAGILLTAGGIAAFVFQSGADEGAISPAPAITPQPTPVPAKNVSYLIVDSFPEGASVFVGGKEKGLTPLVIEIQPGAKYAVFIELDGYETVFESVMLEPSNSAL